MRLIILLITTLFLLTACQEKGKLNLPKITISSKEFTEGKAIPPKFTCKDKNISPSLSWEPTPTGTKTFALIVDDPDAPSGNFVHWVIFNIPANTTSLSENQPNKEKLEKGIIQGKNSFSKTGYSGPCPPSGTHRYYFKIYGVDKELDLSPDTDKEHLLKALEGHITGQGELIGTFSK